MMVQICSLRTLIWRIPNCAFYIMLLIDLGESWDSSSNPGQVKSMTGVPRLALSTIQIWGREVN